MKKVILATVFVLFVAIVTAFVAYSYVASKTYEGMRAKLATHALKAQPIDEEAQSLLDDVRKNWVVRRRELADAENQAFESLGRPATVANLVDLFTYRMPEYSFGSVTQNGEAIRTAAVQAILLMTTSDGVIHTSSQDKLAFVIVNPGLVYVFTEQADGLHVEVYQDGGGPGGEAQEVDAE